MTETPKKFFLGYYRFDWLARRLARKIMRTKAMRWQVMRVAKTVKNNPSLPIGQVYEKAGSIHLLGIVRGGLGVALTLSDELNYELQKALEKTTGRRVPFELNVGAVSASRTRFGSTALGRLAIDGSITAKRPFRKARKYDVVIIADDLVDDGVTLKGVKKFLAKNSKQFKIITATPIVKKRRVFEPDAYALEIPKHWWVVFPSSRREHGKTPVGVLERDFAVVLKDRKTF